ncbi:helix-turn-helix transcriptional regulator [Flavobacterium sp. F-65]|uniref:Helix-turn-helix transcriptional regulator n=1 Tax=Flavobacterium pisciphilum TaxID=2893755 RepID=A0ABS8MTS8_9FLAO|nr:helix-turn-helix transcriptional regulator [Flavobacterium sp. F-65]MCC9071507.1 helix-turn-helix transcriptional regulator [Flavobacterium sp. F-65]
MQTEIVVKIKKIRIEKGFSPNEMAEKLNIDLSAYSRLESGTTFTWGKYLEDILIIFNLSPECFFKGIGVKNNIRRKKDSLGDCTSFDFFFAEYKEKVKKIEILFEERLKDKDEIIEQLKKNENM